MYPTEMQASFMHFIGALGQGKGVGRVMALGFRMILIMLSPSPL